MTNAELAKIEAVFTDLHDRATYISKLERNIPALVAEVRRLRILFGFYVSAGDDDAPTYAEVERALGISEPPETFEFTVEKMIEAERGEGLELIRGGDGI